jgi:hypothetical protein
VLGSSTTAATMAMNANQNPNPSAVTSRITAISPGSPAARGSGGSEMPSSRAPTAITTNEKAMLAMFTRVMADRPRILPSTQLCAGMAATTCSVTRFCFSPVMLMKTYPTPTKTPISPRTMARIVRIVSPLERGGVAP